MIVAYIILATMAFGMVVGLVAAIWGLISVKLWEHFSVVPDFTESIDDEDGWSLADEIWARKAVRRHYRFIGIRRYTGLDTETRQWFKSLHLQIYKWVDKEIVRWNTKKGLWD